MTRGFTSRVNSKWLMVSRKGAVEWSVGRLMSIVLLMVVLALVIYGVSSGGLKPLHERVEGMFNEVLLFFGIGEREGGDVECLKSVEVDIVDVGDGALKVCRGYCEIELDVEISSEFFGFKSKRFKYDMRTRAMTDGGVKDEGKWYRINNEDYLGLDIEKAGAYRGIYVGMKDGLRDSFFDEDLERFESFMKFNPRSVLELKIDMGGYDRIYRRYGGNRWDYHTTEGASTKAQAGGTYDDEMLIDDVWKYYKDGRSVYWGYKEDGASEEFPTGLHIDSIALASRFSKFINDKKDDWDRKSRVHEDTVEEMNGAEINIGGSGYVLDLYEHCINLNHCTPLIFINLVEDRVGVYYELGKIRFYSKENGDEYENVVIFLDDKWKDVIGINKFYEFLKDVCK